MTNLKKVEEKASPLNTSDGSFFHLLLVPPYTKASLELGRLCLSIPYLHSESLLNRKPEGAQE